MKESIVNTNNEDLYPEVEDEEEEQVPRVTFGAFYAQGKNQPFNVRQLPIKRNSPKAQVDNQTKKKVSKSALERFYGGKGLS